jgi:hypothetical protein
MTNPKENHEMSARARAKTITNTTIDPEEPALRPLGQGKQPDKGQFRLQVDRQTKTSYATFEAAQEAALAIKKAHPTLRVAVYDAVEGVNKLIELPK